MLASEFMVEEHELRKEQIQEDYNDKYWDRRYTVVQRQIPSFLQKMAGKVLSTGAPVPQPSAHLPSVLWLCRVPCCRAGAPLCPGLEQPPQGLPAPRRRPVQLLWLWVPLFCSPALGVVPQVTFLHYFVSRTLLPLTGKLLSCSQPAPDVWLFHTNVQLSCCPWTPAGCPVNSPSPGTEHPGLVGVGSSAAELRLSRRPPRPQCRVPRPPHRHLMWPRAGGSRDAPCRCDDVLGQLTELRATPCSLDHRVIRKDTVSSRVKRSAGGGLGGAEPGSS